MKQRILLFYAYRLKSESQLIVESMGLGSYTVPEIMRHG